MNVFLSCLRYKRKYDVHSYKYIERYITREKNVYTEGGEMSGCETNGYKRMWCRNIRAENHIFRLLALRKYKECIKYYNKVYGLLISNDLEYYIYRSGDPTIIRNCINYKPEYGHYVKVLNMIYLKRLKTIHFSLIENLMSHNSDKVTLELTKCTTNRCQGDDLRVVLYHQKRGGIYYTSNVYYERYKMNNVLQKIQDEIYCLLEKHNIN